MTQHREMLEALGIAVRIIPNPYKLEMITSDDDVMAAPDELLRVEGPDDILERLDDLDCEYALSDEEIDFVRADALRADTTASDIELSRRVLEASLVRVLCN